jgi:hypothetical protein
MRTQGPRMNHARTREVLDKLGINIVKSDGNGIEIHRTAEQPERWQLLTHGGIVANSDQVWLRLVGVKRPDPARLPTRGPYWNKTQLEKALRTWRRGV